MKSNKFVIAFIVYLALLPIIPEQVLEKFPVMDLFIVGIIGTYVIYSLVSRERREKLFQKILFFIKDKIVIFMMIVLVIMGFSAIYAQDKVMAIKETIRFGTYFAMLFFIVSEVDFRYYKEIIIKAIYYPAFFVSLFGIVQKFTGIGLEVNTNGYLRIESTLGHPNSLGVYLVILLIPLTMILINEKKKEKKIFYGLTALIMLSNIVLCLSRNSWVALAFGIVLLAVFYNWRILFAFVVAGVIALLSPAVSSRIIDMGAKVFSDGRIKHWAVAIKMFLDKPLTGVGNGNYVTLHEEYIKRYPSLLVQGEENFPTHNSYLKVLSELGILGFIPFMIMNVLVVMRGFFAYSDAKGKEKNIILGVLIAILVFMQVNLLDNMWFVPKVTTIYWVMVGFIISISNKKTNYR